MALHMISGNKNVRFHSLRLINLHGIKFTPLPPKSACKLENDSTSLEKHKMVPTAWILQLISAPSTMHLFSLREKQNYSSYLKLKPNVNSLLLFQHTQGNEAYAAGWMLRHWNCLLPSKEGALSPPFFHLPHSSCTNPNSGTHAALWN